MILLEGLMGNYLPNTHATHRQNQDWSLVKVLEFRFVLLFLLYCYFKGEVCLFWGEKKKNAGFQTGSLNTAVYRLGRYIFHQN